MFPPLQPYTSYFYTTKTHPRQDLLRDASRLLRQRRQMLPARLQSLGMLRQLPLHFPHCVLGQRLLECGPVP